MYYTTNIWIFFKCFSLVFFIFSYWNFDIGIIVLRSSISVQVSKKIFGIINKRGGVQISIACLGGGAEGVRWKNIQKITSKGVGDVYLENKSKHQHFDQSCISSSLERTSCWLFLYFICST